MKEQNKQQMHPVSKNIEENIKHYQEIFSDCADIKMRKMQLGLNQQVTCFVAYVETSVGNMLLERSILGEIINRFCEVPDEKLVEAIAKNHFGISDAFPFATIEEAADMMLTGDAILFVDGYDKALKIADKGYPAKAVKETDSEKANRGSNEGFAESIKVNTALIRKRIKSPKVKVKEQKLGVRSKTNVDLVYIDDLVEASLLEKIEKRLAEYEVDGVLDSGIIEQLSEKSWISPFPQFQTTLRPDRAAMALLEGRVVLLSDNSPVALIIPSDYNSFIQTSDDYYNRWEIASFTRLLRYAASILAMILPGLYLAVTNFHTQLLPTALLLSFVQARAGVPFPGIVEIILMELSFELLREAGQRLPAGLGGTIGIVGGLIIGQAAVEANIVSGMVVIVVAFTALCSYAIPNTEFAAAFRLLKFGFIFLCAFLGLYGLLLGIMLLLIHLSRLESFDIPYLTPFVGSRKRQTDEMDSLIRPPYFTLRKRPIFANEKQKTRLRKNKENKKANDNKRHE